MNITETPTRRFFQGDPVATKHCPYDLSTLVTKGDEWSVLIGENGEPLLVATADLVEPRPRVPLLTGYMRSDGSLSIQRATQFAGDPIYGSTDVQICGVEITSDMVGLLLPVVCDEAGEVFFAANADRATREVAPEAVTA